MQIQLLTAATATNSPPTAGSATVGFALRGMSAAADTAVSLNVPTHGQCAIVVKSTAGSDTMTVTLRVWVYDNASAEWAPLGTSSTIGNRGVLNEATAITEDNSDALNHTELVNGLQHFDRIYLEITAIGGTATAVSAWLIGR